MDIIGEMYKVKFHPKDYCKAPVDTYAPAPILDMGNLITDQVPLTPAPAPVPAPLDTYDQVQPAPEPAPGPAPHDTFEANTDLNMLNIDLLPFENSGPITLRKDNIQTIIHEKSKPIV